MSNLDHAKLQELAKELAKSVKTQEDLSNLLIVIWINKKLSTPTTLDTLTTHFLITQNHEYTPLILRLFKAVSQNIKTEGYSIISF